MQDYNTIIGAIQMPLNKCPTRSVMDRFRIGSSTLNLIMSRYKALELTIDELEAMSPKEVENLFYPQKNLQRKEVPLPDFQYYYDRIHAPNSRVNISFCWLDYKEKNPDGYEKSQFYEYYQRFVQENYGGTKISMAVNRKPGEKMYIDWVGDQPELLTDVTTGEIMSVHIFATTLGVSSMIYAEAFPNEKLPCFIEGCVHAVSFYGAVAKHFVPDNLKTAVTKHTKDDLVLQSTFSDREDFYDTIVLPPPARKPKGKPTVENHVRYLETHLIEKLKEKIYTSFEDLNADIKKIVAVLNARPFQNQAFSRQEMFIKYDKPCMKPLPGGEYTTCDYKAVLKVPNNYHIDYDGHYYSVLYTYCGHSKIRNKGIANIFSQMGFVEAWGSGIKRILNAAEEYGLPKPKFQEFDNMFRVELFRNSFPMTNEKEDIGEASEKHRRQSGEQTSTIHSKRWQRRKHTSTGDSGAKTETC